MIEYLRSTDRAVSGYPDTARAPADGSARERGSSRSHASTRVPAARLAPRSLAHQLRSLSPPRRPAPQPSSSPMATQRICRLGQHVAGAHSAAAASAKHGDGTPVVAVRARCELGGAEGEASGVGELVAGCLSQNVSKCLKMSQNVSKCLKMSQNVSKCLKMSQTVSKCLKLSQNVSNCLKLSQTVSNCLKLSQNVSKCLKLSQNVSKCLAERRGGASGVGELVAGSLGGRTDRRVEPP
eukprot:SAG31_NODE_2280_length_6025_cov_8.850321_8_plen_239_part_00